jgi:hypothetical protein
MIAVTKADRAVIVRLLKVTEELLQGALDSVTIKPGGKVQKQYRLVAARDFRDLRAARRMREKLEAL